MSSGKKVLNVFGIIFAWILSIVLVLTLIVSPIVLSSLSLLSPKNLSKAVTSIDVSELIASENGDNSENDGMAALLSTNAAKDVFELYATDITNSLSGKTVESKLTADAFQKIVEDNMDELVAILKEENGATDMSEEELKTAIRESFSENADEIMATLPNPQDLTAQLTEENPEIQTAFDIIGKANTIKLSIIGAIVLISALIFVCRLFDFKGVRWLSVDLFVASGVLILVCAGLSLGSGAVGEALAGEKTIGAVVGSFSSSFTTGLIIRTAVMLVFAIGLMVAYVFIKKARAKKALAAESTTIAAEVVLEETVIQENAEIN